MLLMPHVLLADDDPITSTIVVSGMLLILVIFGFAAVMKLRKNLKGRAEDPLQDPTAAQAGFTLGDLRNLHKAGKMTDEEFKRAQTKLIAMTRNAELKTAGAPATPAQRKRQDRG